ncbi:hypothetical protein [Paenibacillus thiaminolyticus]|uniref:hypothetical protein n=1 Tax=Paenibacillus thiaminolyticus TaxID=49283 RepID=UPI0011C3BB21|nr:hypothetical protein [Paenibacillus thiaminolyticus]
MTSYNTVFTLRWASPLGLPEVNQRSGACSYDPQGDDGYPIPEYYRTFYCIEFGTGQVVLQHTYKDGKIAAIQISPDERLLAVGLFGATMAVWDIASREVVAERDDFVWLGLPSHVGMTRRHSPSPRPVSGLCMPPNVHIIIMSPSSLRYGSAARHARSRCSLAASMLCAASILMKSGMSCGYTRRRPSGSGSSVRQS